MGGCQRKEEDPDAPLSPTSTRSTGSVRSDQQVGGARSRGNSYAAAVADMGGFATLAFPQASADLCEVTHEHARSAFLNQPTQASGTGDEAAVIAILEEHPSCVNAKIDGTTPLMAAAQNGRASCVQLLLDHGDPLLLNHGVMHGALLQTTVNHCR